MSRSIRYVAGLGALAAVFLSAALGHAAPPPPKAPELVMLVDNGPVTPTQGFPGVTYISFARVRGDGTVEPGPFVVPAGQVLILTSASGSQSGPNNAVNTLTLYAWAQPDAAVRGLYGNNFRTDGIGYGDIRIDFGVGFALADGHALLATSPIANLGLNFQGYLASE